VTCPKGTAARTPDFAKAAGLNCKTCGSAPSSVMDTDPTALGYFVYMTFGDMQNKAGAFVAGVSHYEVHWVDGDGRSVALVGKVPASSATCCDNSKYKVSIAGTWGSASVAGTYMLAIKPFSTGGNLPFITYTNVIADKTGGTAKKTIGSYTIKLSDADVIKLVKTPAAVGVFRAALAATISGVTVEQISITAISVADVSQTIRRLEERRLANQDVKVDYTILTNTKLVVAADIVAATLKTNIEAQATAAGKSVTVVATPTVPAPVGTSVGAPIDATGAASPIFFPSLAAIIAVGSHLAL